MAGDGGTSTRNSLNHANRAFAVAPMGQSREIIGISQNYLSHHPPPLRYGVISLQIASAGALSK
jgi:hypothetical protein